MQISFAWRPSEKIGKLRDLDLLALCSGKLRFSLPLLSSELDLITDIEMGCDSEEAPEKWEPGLPAAFEGRWGRTTSPSRSYLLRKGQENNTAKQLPAENATLCLHTTHPRAVKLPFPMKMKVEGEAR